MGRDPLQRILRTISVLAFLILVGVLIVDKDRQTDIALDALLVGAILIQLGYDIAIPFLSGVIERRNGRDVH